jgi:hypothetical protein
MNPAGTHPPDEDFCRTKLRGLRHVIALAEQEHGAAPVPWGNVLARVKDLADEALARPRSNGATIDALERDNAELRGKLVDIEMLEHERRMALQAAEVAERRARAAEATLEGSGMERAYRWVADLLGKRK